MSDYITPPVRNPKETNQFGDAFIICATVMLYGSESLYESNAWLIIGLDTNKAPNHPTYCEYITSKKGGW